MADSREIKTMRYMEWERAKGSIRAILASFWDWDRDRDEDELSHLELQQLADIFIVDFGEGAALD